MSGSGQVQYTRDDNYICGYLISGESGDTAIYVSASLEEAGAAASVIRIILAVVSVLALLLSFVFALFISKRFAKPVTELVGKAESLGDESYATGGIGFCTELKTLSDTLDSTDKRLKEAKVYQRELLANVSHDLRTPLTMIKGYAEMVRDDSWSDESLRNEDTGIIIREADRLTALVNDILRYSELCQEDYRAELEKLILSDIVSETVSSFEPVAAASGGTIEKDIDTSAVIGDRQLLQRAIFNLVDNAVRHSGDSGRVSVSLKNDGRKTVLEVKDSGGGIPAGELEHIWEKYYTSRQRKGKGTSGLGLAIVKEIADIHSAECYAQSAVGEGSSFFMVFDSVPLDLETQE